MKLLIMKSSPPSSHALFGPYVSLTTPSQTSQVCDPTLGWRTKFHSHCVF